MGRVCAAAGCTGGSKPMQAERQLRGLRQLTLFKVPKCEAMRQQWAESLGVVFNKNDFICEMHFCNNDVLREDIVKIEGTTHILPRERYDLAKGAIPQKGIQVDERAEVIEQPSTSHADSDIEENNESIQRVDGNVGISSHDETPLETLLTAPNTLTPAALKLHLSQKPLPRTWSWTTSPGSEDEIVLFQVDPLSFKMRIRLHIHKDLSAKMRTCDDLGELDITDHITTIPEFDKFIKTVEAVKLCSGSGISTQSRSKNCLVIADRSYQRTNIPRCVHCAKARRLHLDKIRRQSGDLKTRYARSKKKALIQLRKYQRLVSKTQKLRSAIANAKAACAAIKEEELTRQISALPELQQHAATAIFQAAKTVSSHGRRYTTDWVYECLLMRIKNGKLYEHLRTRNILPLPCKDTLGKYIQKIQVSKYGFQSVIFECMRRKGLHMDASSRRGVLLVDEMKLTESVSFNRRTMRFNGFVDLGNHTPKQQETTRADHALVFMFQPFRGSWVQALGCFLSKDCVTSAILHKLILECIVLLGNAEFHVDTVTMDGAQWNRGVWTLFGINKENVKCTHPHDPMKDLTFVSDFPHLVKCLRNGIVRKEEFWTPDGVVKKMHWSSVLECESYAGPTLKIAYNLSPAHLNPKGYQKMNVPMAFQLFGDQVRVAMEIYGKDGRCPGLHDSAPTQMLIKRVNDLIEVMMARTPYHAVYHDNRYQRKKVIIDFIQYLQAWEQSAKYRSIDLPISSSTLTGLKISLGATLEILKGLHEDSDFEFLMTARLNQDALERFFGMMRQSCGANGHPDPLVFSQVFRLLSTYSLVKPPRGCNVSGQELLQTLMRTNESVTAARDLRDQWLCQIDTLLEHGSVKSCDSRESIEVKGDQSAVTRSCSSSGHLVDHSYDVYSSSDEVQSYLAGYVARKMERSLMCSYCVATLKSTKTDREPRDAVIESINRGRLLFPSERLFRLTQVLEKCVLDVVGKMGVNIETLNSILHAISEHRHLPMVGCESHKKETIDFYLIIRAHFLSKAFNNNNNSREKSRMYRKRAKL